MNAPHHFFRLKGTRMKNELSTIDLIAGVFCQANQEVLEASSRKEIQYSKTIQKVPKISMKPEIGCFVPFNGDYNGLVVFNYSGDAAMTLYKSSLMLMGIPED